MFDEHGQTLTSTHTVKKGRRHRYYVSRRLLTEEPGATAKRGWRLPAGEIEHSVAAAAATLLEDKAGLVTAIEQRGIEAERIVPMLEQAAGWVRKLRSGDQGEALAALVDRVDLTGSGFKLTLRLPASLKESSDALTLERLVPITMKRRGVARRKFRPRRRRQNRPNALHHRHHSATPGTLRQVSPVLRSQIDLV